MATLTVGPPNSGQEFTSIQAAINAAFAGDTIVVQSGIYNENLTIDKAIILEGPNQGIAPTVPDINPTGGIDVNEGYRANPEAWIQGTVTVTANDVTIDGFRLRNEEGTLQWVGEPNNFKLLNNYVTGYSADNAPIFGDASSITPPLDTNVVTGWQIDSNYIGGLTGGTGASMELAGLGSSSINNNTFWRPRAAHIYLASLTNVTIEGNNFYHGLHADGADYDGLGQYFSGDGYGYGYGYGRNYWFELKGVNDTVNILSNTGEYNSGGIQLWGETTEPFVFDNITIEGNTFPTNNFINPYTEAPTNGLSGLIPAVMATAAEGGPSGSNLVIRDNTVSVDLSQVKYATDHKSSLEVRGNFDGVTVAGNTIAPTGVSNGDLLIAGLNLLGSLPGDVVIDGNNQFLGAGGDPQAAPYYGIDMFPVFDGYGTFSGSLAIQDNTFDSWEIGVVLRDAAELGGSTVDIAGNTFTNNNSNVFDDIPPEVNDPTAFSYDEQQVRGATIGTVNGSDNLPNTDNVGVVNFLITDGNASNFFAIDSTGNISLTKFGEASAANNFDLLPNAFEIEVTAVDGGGLQSTPATTITLTVLDILKTTVAPEADGTLVVREPDGNEIQVGLNGQPVNVFEQGDWVFLAGATVDGVNQVLWLNQATSQIGIWNTDANWNYDVDSDVVEVYPFRSLETIQAEVDFRFDINGDGFFGDDLVPIESEGSVTLLEGVFNFLHAQPQGGTATPITVAGEGYENLTNNWQALAAETISGVNQVLHVDNSLNVPSFAIWNTDPNWNYINNDTVAPISSFQTMQAEFDFQVDVNGDGVVGDIYTPIEENGSVALLQGQYGTLAAQGLDPLTNPSPLQFEEQLFNNDPGVWTPLAADVIGGVNQVLWEAVANDTLWTWDTNDVWNFVSASGPVAPGTPEYQALLDAFGVDASALG